MIVRLSLAFILSIVDQVYPQNLSTDQLLTVPNLLRSDQSFNESIQNQLPEQTLRKSVGDNRIYSENLLQNKSKTLGQSSPEQQVTDLFLDSFLHKQDPEIAVSPFSAEVNNRVNGDDLYKPKNNFTEHNRRKSTLDGHTPNHELRKPWHNWHKDPRRNPSRDQTYTSSSVHDHELSNTKNISTEHNRHTTHLDSNTPDHELSKPWRKDPRRNPSRDQTYTSDSVDDKELSNTKNNSAEYNSQKTYLDSNTPDHELNKDPRRGPTRIQSNISASVDDNELPNTKNNSTEHNRQKPHLDSNTPYHELRKPWHNWHKDPRRSPSRDETYTSASFDDNEELPNTKNNSTEYNRHKTHLNSNTPDHELLIKPWRKDPRRNPSRDQTYTSASVDDNEELPNTKNNSTEHNRHKTHLDSNTPDHKLSKPWRKDPRRNPSRDQTYTSASVDDNELPNTKNNSTEHNRHKTNLDSNTPDYELSKPWHKDPRRNPPRDQTYTSASVDDNELPNTKNNSTEHNRHKTHLDSNTPDHKLSKPWRKDPRRNLSRDQTYTSASNDDNELSGSTFIFTEYNHQKASLSGYTQGQELRNPWQRDLRQNPSIYQTYVGASVDYDDLSEPKISFTGHNSQKAPLDGHTPDHYLRKPWHKGPRRNPSRYQTYDTLDGDLDNDDVSEPNYNGDHINARAYDYELPEPKLKAKERRPLRPWIPRNPLHDNVYDFELPELKPKYTRRRPLKQWNARYLIDDHVFDHELRELNPEFKRRRFSRPWVQKYNVHYSGFDYELPEPNLKAKERRPLIPWIPRNPLDNNFYDFQLPESKTKYTRRRHLRQWDRRYPAHDPGFDYELPDTLMFTRQRPLKVWNSRHPISEFPGRNPSRLFRNRLLDSNLPKFWSNSQGVWPSELPFSRSSIGGYIPHYGTLEPRFKPSRPQSGESIADYDLELQPKSTKTVPIRNNVDNQRPRIDISHRLNN